MDEKIVELLERNTQILEKMNSKDAVGVHTAVPLHGIGGLWSGAGIENPVISAYVRPYGIGTILPRLPTVIEDPRYSALTGFTAVTGTRPTSSCEDAQKGYVKSCELTARFGLNRIDTQEIEMDKTMLRANRGDRMDLRLAGDVLGMSGFTPEGLTDDNILQVVTKMEMIVAGSNIERQLMTDTWTGAVAAGSFPGLDNQIVTGQVDARTNVACPALDSDVKDFNYNDVCGTTLDIVEYLSMMAWYLDHIAIRTGLAPVNWVIAMRAELWFELSACWPCSYLSNRCNTAAGANISVINDNVNVNARDAMREGMYIDINGRRYPVITDDGIFEHNNVNNANLAAGTFASSIYFVPLAALGGTLRTTFIEYLDYRKAARDVALLHGTEPFWWTDSGMFSWALTDRKWCYQLHLKTEPRVVLRTPHLAGKLQHVMYTPLQHLRSYDPDSAYMFDGGVSTPHPGTTYSVWLGQGGGR